jgi:hypothetical protein
LALRLEIANAKPKRQDQDQDIQQRKARVSEKLRLQLEVANAELKELRIRHELSNAIDAEAAKSPLRTKTSTVMSWWSFCDLPALGTCRQT